MKFLTLALLLAPFSAQAASSELAEARALFQKGAYQQAAEKAERIHPRGTEEARAVPLFLAGTYAKLQAFDKASEQYAAALRAGARAESLHYDYGQALFAQQKLPAAEEQFKDSIRQNFKTAASAYYVAYIRGILDDKKGARDYYQRIQKLPRDPDHVKQPALLQLAELSFEETNELKGNPRRKTERKNRLENEVLPAYRRARDFAPESPVAEQARARIAEVESELEQMVERMRNGNPVPRQAFALQLTQDFTYDTNVITQADEVLIAASNVDALVWKTGALAKYQFNWNRTLSFIPELGSTITLHSRRSVPSVYQNDNISLSPAFRTKLEHWSGGRPATLQLDLEFNLMLRDYNAVHEFPFYTRYYNYALSERVKWFETGSTTFKANIKFLDNYIDAKTYYSPGISITQLVRVNDTQSLVNTVSADYIHARDSANDERNYKYRGSLTFPRVFEKVDFTPSFALGVKDTVNQRYFRGWETNVSPSAALNRPFGPNFDGTFEYTFTKNYSKSKDTYQYTKHEMHFGLAYNF